MVNKCELKSKPYKLIRHLAAFGGTVLVAVTAALAGGLPVTAAAAKAPASSGRWVWPRTLPVPGGYKDGTFTALSCTSPLNCSAAGTYTDGAGVTRIYAINKKGGVWGKGLRIDFPTTAYYPSLVLSCASAGNCAAGGHYAPPTGAGKGYVVTESNGSWGKAQQVPGTAPPSSVSGIACPAPGECTAVGASGKGAHGSAFLVNERHGTWRKAFWVPGLTALTGGHDASSLQEISCPSLGNCTAAGGYGPFGGDTTEFVVTEKHGIWGKPQPIAGRLIYALSCRSAGNCAAGWADPGSPGVFVIAQANGIWGKPKLLPGTPQLSQDGSQAEINQIICPAAGQCTVLGQTSSYSPGYDTLQPFVAVQKNGIWRNAQRIAGTSNNNLSVTFSLSCPTAGNCVLGGSVPARGGWQAGFAAEVNGIWGPARFLEGSLALDHGHASQIDAVSCAALNRCVAVGTFYGNKANRLPLATVQR